MSTLPKSHLTPEEYLAIERAAETKSEYFDGRMFAMSGARWVHNRIAVHLASEFDRQLRGRPCGVGNSDQRVCVSPSGPYVYPDVAVVCGKPEFLDAELDTLINPTLIVEVLSPSTEKYDRGRKFDQYKRIASLRDYLLVSSDCIQADLYTRQPDGRWLFSRANTAEDTIDIPSLSCILKMSDVYADVVF